MNDYNQPFDANALIHMRERFPWLADHVESMLGGDPWQEGAYARDILADYRKNEMPS